MVELEQENESTRNDNAAAAGSEAVNAETPVAEGQEESKSVLKREIRLDLICMSLMRNWRKYVVPMIVTFVITALVVLQMPRYYTVSVMLAPESTNAGSVSGGLGSLASMAGINLSSMNSSDAIIPTFYPDLMKSTDFIVPLFNAKVQTKNGKFKGTYAEYLTKYCKPSLITQGLTWVKHKIAPPKDTRIHVKNGEYTADPFRLTKPENDLCKIISGSIECSVDKKTDVISIKVTDQDPLVAAQLADTVKTRLQDFITDYRTKKAKNDLNHYVDLCQKAQEEYDRKQQEYARYADSNRDVVLESFRMKEEMLENEMQLAYNNYSNLKQQVQLAEAKVMERTPAFTTIQNASVPVKHAGPKRMIITAAMLVLCFLAVSVYIILKDKTLKF